MTKTKKNTLGSVSVSDEEAPEVSLKEEMESLVDLEADTDGGFTTPLDEPVIERDYSKNSGADIPDEHKADVPEPDFEPTREPNPFREGGGDNSFGTEDGGGDDFGSFDFGGGFGEKIDSGKGSDFGGSGGGGQKISSGNAKRTAKQIVNTYYLPITTGLAIKFASFDIAKAEKLSIEGKLDIQEFLPLGENHEITLRTHMEEHNQKIANAFSMNEDTKAEMIDALADLLKEKGVELTPMQRLLMAVGSDILDRGQQVLAINLQNKAILEALIKRHEEKKKPSSDAEEVKIVN